MRVNKNLPFVQGIMIFKEKVERFPRMLPIINT